MISFNNIEVVGWEHAVRGMRNPKNSWYKIDSVFESPYYEEDGKLVTLEIGENDMRLMKALNKGGPVHAKYRRMITVYLDITAPLYWWKEFDTYKVGTVANSCSTMHKIHAKVFEPADFSTEHLNKDSFAILGTTIAALNVYRDNYVKSLDKQDWWQLIQLLPTSYNQTRTVMLNYEVLANIYKFRKDHKLDEWHSFCDMIKSLPYSELIIGETEDAE